MRIGLCGWTINAARYFELFDTLEVQQTFYEPPSRVTMDRWREQAPAGFVFTIKAWQVITHRSTSNTYRRLRSDIDRDEAVQSCSRSPHACRTRTPPSCSTTSRAWMTQHDSALSMECGSTP